VEQAGSTPKLIGLHSEDGQWWWDGQAWLPAYSVDGKRWFDGVAWARTAPKRGSLRALRDGPRWLKWSLIPWAILLVAWIPSVDVVASHHDSWQVITTIAVALGTLAVIGTMGFGALLGYLRHWRYLAWAILGGTVLAGMFVFFTFAGSQPANAPDDPGLGLGAMLVTVAMAPVIAAFLWLGGVIGLLFRRLSNSHLRAN
jgi:nitrate reductase gamma subunit